MLIVFYSEKETQTGSIQKHSMKLKYLDEVCRLKEIT
jgi:hypothetical protein